MPRYINADKFVEWIDAGHLRSANEICLSENNVLKMIELQPTADVIEVKHGHWIRKDYKPCGHDYICSVCGFGVPMEYKHCPDCTAKMDSKS